MQYKNPAVILQGAEPQKLTMRPGCNWARDEARMLVYPMEFNQYGGSRSWVGPLCPEKVGVHWSLTSLMQLKDLDNSVLPHLSDGKKKKKIRSPKWFFQYHTIKSLGFLDTDLMLCPCQRYPNKARSNLGCTFWNSTPSHYGKWSNRGPRWWSLGDWTNACFPSLCSLPQWFDEYVSRHCVNGRFAKVGCSDFYLQ